MDYAELFDRQGEIFDDLLMAAAKVPAARFAEPAPDGGPSLRDLLVRMLDEQRAVLHGVLLGRRHVPLAARAIVSPLELGPVFGGFRLTLRDYLDDLSREDLARPVALPDGRTGATVDDVLAHLVLLDARLRGIAGERLRALGVEPPPLDFLDEDRGDAPPPAEEDDDDDDDNDDNDDDDADDGDELTREEE